VLVDCEEKAEEFPDDFQSETDEDEYSVDWHGVTSDAVDSHRCELFAIAEEKSPDLIREANDQSWTDTEINHELEVTATDELEAYEDMESNRGHQWKTSDKEEDISYTLDNEQYPETLWSANYDFEGEESGCPANEVAHRSTPDAEDQPGFDRKVSELFNRAMSRSYGVDGLSTHREPVVDEGEVNDPYTEENIPTYEPHRLTHHDDNDDDDGCCLDDGDQDQNEAESRPEETFDDQEEISYSLDKERYTWTANGNFDGEESDGCLADDAADPEAGDQLSSLQDGEKAADWNTCGGVADEMEDDIAERCAWNGGNHDFITSEVDSWRGMDQPLDPDLHHDSGRETPEAEMPKSDEQSANELYIRKERFNDDRDPHADGYWNEACQKSADFASVPTSSLDVVHGGRQTPDDKDHSQQRIVGRRWAKLSGSGTADEIQTTQMSRDRETDQSAAEEDTLPRRGHMKNLLAQWRELEQRRKDEELIELAASASSDRSRRTAVRTAWFKAPDPDRLTSSRSQSCGPVSRRPAAKVRDFDDNSSSWRNGSVDDDGEESQMTFDRMAIKEKFERLDAEAQRTTIFNRKKVDNCLVFTLLSHRLKLFFRRDHSFTCEIYKRLLSQSDVLTHKIINYCLEPRSCNITASQNSQLHRIYNRFLPRTF